MLPDQAQNGAHGAVVTAEQLSIGYLKPRHTARVIAERISVSLQSGELVCLLGPNGAGKSTLIRTLCGMQPPLAGRVFVQGTPVDQMSPRTLARCLSVVLTERLDVGALTAEDLVALGRYPYTDWRGRLRAEDCRVVRWALKTMDATPLAGRRVGELSDGERQKVMIARALAQAPLAMVLDEPTAFLDLPRRVDIMGTLRRLARQTGQAILLSTHDLDLALRSADSIWLLAHGGRVHTGAPEDLVLSGAFQAAFDTNGIEFDAATGSFRLHHPCSGEIALRGEGVAALWTARALEREGFLTRAGASGLPLEVEILTNHGHARWHVRMGRDERLCHSIADLIACLRSGAGRGVAPKIGCSGQAGEQVAALESSGSLRANGHYRRAEN